MAGLMLCAGCLVALPMTVALADHHTDEAKKAAKDVVKQAKDAGKQAVKDATQQAEHGMSPEAAAMMQKAMENMQAYGTTNEHHAHLATLVGEWDLKTKWWMDPSMPPSEDTMTSVATMSMDGKVLMEKVSGMVSMDPTQPEVKFEGMSLMGYDTSKNKYWSHWMDNMMTGCMSEWGTCSADGKVITMEGENYNCMHGKMAKSKSVVTVTDANSRKIEMFSPGLDGKMFKTMEIVYTRKK